MVSAKKRIAIAGVGVVGHAVAEYFRASSNCTILLYDPPRGFNKKSVLRDADVVFLCVPTPYAAKGFDLSYLDAVLPLIASGRTVVIKSTVLPGTTESYQQRYPDLRLLFNPEFLSEKTAVEDFRNPTRQIVGYASNGKAAAQLILDLLPRAHYSAVVTATEAEMVKYFNNSFYALKVIYANLIYDLCSKLGIDYTRVSEAAVSNEPWMGQNHWDVLHGGYRGYGGKCLPKDVQSLIQLGRQVGVEMQLLELVHDINSRLKQGNVADA